MTEPSDEVIYTVKRLIKGLASDRGCARLGYAAALEQVHILQMYNVNRFLPLRIEKSSEMCQILTNFIKILYEVLEGVFNHLKAKIIYIVE